MHFGHHAACPVANSCNEMGGTIVKKLMNPLFSAFFCICSVPCKGVECIGGNFVYSLSIKEDRAQNLLEAFFSTSSSLVEISASDNFCNLWPIIGGGTGYGEFCRHLGGWLNLWRHFLMEPGMVMSTYLVAFVVP